MIFIRTLIPEQLLIAFTAIGTYAVVSMLFATPFVRRYAVRFHFVDRPDDRRMHDNSIPNIGGLAFAFSLLSGLWLSQFFHPAMSGFVSAKLPGLIAGVFIIVMAGLYDDAHGLNFIQKFSVQAIVGAILYFTGFQITTIPAFGFGPIALGWFSLPFTMLWVSALCNAINLIDGLDGLASGLVCIASFIIFILSVFQGDVVAAFISLILCCISATFLYYNFYPAKIFMGDTGSLFLGLVLACLIIHKIDFMKTSEQLVPMVVILGIPVFDMSMTIVRRAIRKRHLFKADRLHIHHRLIDMLGMSHKRAVLTLYGWSFGFGSLGLLLAVGNSASIAFALSIVLIVVGYATIKLRYFSK